MTPQHRSSPQMLWETGIREYVMCFTSTHPQSQLQIPLTCNSWPRIVWAINSIPSVLQRVLWHIGIKCVWLCSVSVSYYQDSCFCLFLAFNYRSVTVSKCKGNVKPLLFNTLCKCVSTSSSGSRRNREKITSPARLVASHIYIVDEPVK